MLTEGLKAFYRFPALEAGVDEAGRGCLAGPVFAAAVILPAGFHHPLLRDSKQMKKKHRDQLRLIIESEAAAWCIGQASVEEIDRYNILQATFLAMHRAINGLSIQPALLLIDGNRFKVYEDIPHQTFIGGDDLFLSIAAASVLAKTHRDEYMQTLHETFPDYGFNRHKGYGTAEHRDAILSKGITAYHRRSFSLHNKQLELF